MSPRSIQEYAETLRPRYLTAKRAEKGRVLTEFCRLTGYHRKAAIRLLHRRPLTPPRRSGRPRRYGPAVTDALRELWEVSDYLCAKRLQPFLPDLIRLLEAHGELTLPSRIRHEVLAVSPATIDRRLKPFRLKRPRQPYLPRAKSTSLRAQVPLRTFGEWANVRPGALQADLVLHCGEHLAGFYLSSLVTVDVATGWTECRAIWGHGVVRVRAALHRVYQQLPFPLRELHTDNGDEFLNHSLVPWCRHVGIQHTRGRPYKKNDQAYVEQKVWTAVRRLVGYDRFCTRRAHERLVEVYDLLGLYLNFFQPLRKVIAKRRTGAKVTKHYDRAQTPYQRLRASGILEESRRQTLEAQYLSLNPRALRANIYQALERLWKEADASHTVTSFLRQRSALR